MQHIILGVCCMPSDKCEKSLITSTVQNCALMNQMRELVYVFVCYNIAGPFHALTLHPPPYTHFINIPLLHFKPTRNNRYIIRKFKSCSQWDSHDALLGSTSSTTFRCTLCNGPLHMYFCINTICIILQWLAHKIYHNKEWGGGEEGQIPNWH